LETTVVVFNEITTERGQVLALVMPDAVRPIVWIKISKRNPLFISEVRVFVLIVA